MDTSIIRKLAASGNKVFTDVATETLRANILYLGIEDSESNYKEIPADTPLLTDEATTDEASTEDLYNALAELGVKSDE